MKPAAPPALVCALLALGGVGPAGAARAQTVVYVNAGLATGANTGASWADACRGADALQRGLDAAAPIAGAGQTLCCHRASMPSISEGCEGGGVSNCTTTAP